MQDLINDFMELFRHIEKTGKTNSTSWEAISITCHCLVGIVKLLPKDSEGLSVYLLMVGAEILKGPESINAEMDRMAVTAHLKSIGVFQELEKRIKMAIAEKEGENHTKH